MPTVYWVSPVVLSYPDQLLSEIWVQWSEDLLGQQHADTYTTPTGFQDRIGATDSTQRTRAGELFNLGLLLGTLVNPRGGSRKSIPLGWSLVQEDQHVHTRLGYISYLIGKSLTLSSEKITRAFRVLCAIFCIQSGFKYDSHYILTLSLFEFLLATFKPKEGFEDTPRWRRYLATAMFNTLHNSEAGTNNLINAYLSNVVPHTIWFMRSQSPLEEVTPEILFNYASDSVDISSTSPPRHAAFWIGNPNRLPLRGYYSVAYEESRDLLIDVLRMERMALDAGQPNPFLVILNESRGSIDVLDELAKIFASHGMLNDWQVHMQTLIAGAEEALEFIKGGTPTPQPKIRVFYGYEINGVIGDQNLHINVPVQQCPILPNPGDLIQLESIQYRIELIEQSEDTISFQAVWV